MSRNKRTIKLFPEQDWVERHERNNQNTNPNPTYAKKKERSQLLKTTLLADVINVNITARSAPCLKIET